MNRSIFPTIGENRAASQSYKKYRDTMKVSEMHIRTGRGRVGDKKGVSKYRKDEKVLHFAQNVLFHAIRTKAVRLLGVGRADVRHRFMTCICDLCQMRKNKVRHVYVRRRCGGYG